eukprot:g1200.t1
MRKEVRHVKNLQEMLDGFAVDRESQRTIADWRSFGPWLKRHLQTLERQLLEGPLFFAAKAEAELPPVFLWQLGESSTDPLVADAARRISELIRVTGRLGAVVTELLKVTTAAGHLRNCSYYGDVVKRRAAVKETAALALVNDFPAVRTALHGTAAEDAVRQLFAYLKQFIEEGRGGGNHFYRQARKQHGTLREYSAAISEARRLASEAVREKMLAAARSLADWGMVLRKTVEVGNEAEGKPGEVAEVCPVCAPAKIVFPENNAKECMADNFGEAFLSVGSVGHHEGKCVGVGCKFQKKGCKRGKDCPRCHLESDVEPPRQPSDEWREKKTTGLMKKELEEAGPEGSGSAARLEEALSKGSVGHYEGKCCTRGCNSGEPSSSSGEPPFPRDSRGGPVLSGDVAAPDRVAEVDGGAVVIEGSCPNFGSGAVATTASPPTEDGAAFVWRATRRHKGGTWVDKAGEDQRAAAESGRIDEKARETLEGYLESQYPSPNDGELVSLEGFACRYSAARGGIWTDAKLSDFAASMPFMESISERGERLHDFASLSRVESGYTASAVDEAPRGAAGGDDREQPFFLHQPVPQRPCPPPGRFALPGAPSPGGGSAVTAWLNHFDDAAEPQQQHGPGDGLLRYRPLSRDCAAASPDTKRVSRSASCFRLSQSQSPGASTMTPCSSVAGGASFTTVGSPSALSRKTSPLLTTYAGAAGMPLLTPRYPRGPEPLSYPRDSGGADLFSRGREEVRWTERGRMASDSFESLPSLGPSAKASPARELSPEGQLFEDVGSILRGEISSKECWGEAASPPPVGRCYAEGERTVLEPGQSTPDFGADRWSTPRRGANLSRPRYVAPTPTRIPFPTRIPHLAAAEASLSAAESGYVMHYATYGADCSGLYHVCSEGCSSDAEQGEPMYLRLNTLGAPAPGDAGPDDAFRAGVANELRAPNGSCCASLTEAGSAWEAGLASTDALQQEPLFTDADVELLWLSFVKVAWARWREMGEILDRRNSGAAGEGSGQRQTEAHAELASELLQVVESGAERLSDKLIESLHLGATKLGKGKWCLRL